MIPTINHLCGKTIDKWHVKSVKPDETQPKREHKFNTPSTQSLSSSVVNRYTPQHVAVFLDHLKGGGVQKMRVIIASALAERGHKIDLVVCRAEGPLLEQVRGNVRIIELKPQAPALARIYAVAAYPWSQSPLLLLALLARKISPTLPYLADLVRYIRRENPNVLLSATPYMNIEAALARHLAKVPIRLVVSEHNDLSHGHPLGKGWRGRYLRQLLRRIYREADAVVAVSNGVADDLAVRTSLPRDRITTIYNPAVTPELIRKAQESPHHAWFQRGSPPVVLGVGRLGQAKDFPTLIRAFAHLRRQRSARLMILGDDKNAKKTAKRRDKLTLLAAELGIAEDVALLGYVPNPFSYMAHAAVFVLSSIYEGFGNVLVEALACGCPVVSTDCPSGPAEILADGKFGLLVPVGDTVALANAISSVLDAPPDPHKLQERATLFSVDRAVDQYEKLLFNTKKPTHDS